MQVLVPAQNAAITNAKNECLLLWLREDVTVWSNQTKCVIVIRQSNTP
jgi:hypothetical protein